MIDILLSTYNGDRYLSEFLESIMRQSYPHWHLWIRDDGSNDDTHCIIQHYADTNPTKITILNDDLGNVGCLRSFEILLYHAQAQYMMFADQDDVWLPDKIKHAMALMCNAECEYGQDVPIIIYSDLQVVDNQLHGIQPSFWKMSKIHPELLQSPVKMASSNFVTGCTMLFNKASKLVSLPFGKQAILHDAVVALSTMVHHGKLIQNPHSDILYRQHENNVVGATAVKNTWEYVIRKIMHLPTILQAYEKLYLQAKNIFHISRIEFYINRFIYILQR